MDDNTGANEPEDQHEVLSEARKCSDMGDGSPVTTKLLETLRE